MKGLNQPMEAIAEGQTQPLNEMMSSSRYDIVNVVNDAVPDRDFAEIMVEVFKRTTTDHSDTTPTIACRVVVTASDGSHPDGGDQGVYADGRFFCEGRFVVHVPRGVTAIRIEKGPSYVPLTAIVNASPGQRVHIRAWLYKWFAPEDMGWYGGDNHVHSQHDVTAMQKTGLYYTALQGRANGLSYITESGSHVSYDNIDELSTDDFLLRYAEELGPVCYTGHLNTPGVTVPFSAEQIRQMSQTPLFTQNVVEAATRLGAAVIYTHPLTPTHQIHWMGATEAFSDAVLGRCANLFDIDSRAAEFFWFSLLNLGNRLGCSSYTDSTLERLNTLTPGDRRVYCHANVLDYSAIVEALRLGRTFASNGPLFAFFTIDGYEPGDTIPAVPAFTYNSRIKIHSLHPLKQAELYRNGVAVATFDLAGQSGAVALTQPCEESDNSWYVFRVEDESGHWCITSPIYFEGPPPEEKSFSSAIVFEISNHTRFAYLECNYFAHVVVTVSVIDPIAEVQLLKDQSTYASFIPEEGDHMPSGRIPVTESEEGVSYEPGWMWYPIEGQNLHFQLDFAVPESGNYAVCVTTVSGRVIMSDSILFDNEAMSSQAISIAQLKGNGTEFALWGYGEEKRVSTDLELREDRWWYPQNAVWRVVAVFNGNEHELFGSASKHATRTPEEVQEQLLKLFHAENSL